MDVFLNILNKVESDGLNSLFQSNWDFSVFTRETLSWVSSNHEVVEPSDSD